MSSFEVVIQVIISKIQMREGMPIDENIQSIAQEINYIENNRDERNKKYKECLANFKQFLKKEAEQLQDTEQRNNQTKQLISKAFECTYDRVLAASDLTVRKIKQTFNQKKIFWDNVIKMNASIDDIELKREFYLQKRNAEEGYLEAVDRQKDKHKNYKNLISTEKKKEQLREYQQSNKLFEEKVIEGTDTLQQWRNVSKDTNKYGTYAYQAPTTGVINQFVNPNYYYDAVAQKNGSLRPISSDAENSTVFINNFQRRK